MTRTIELTQGKFAIVDEDDFELLSKYKWYALRKGKRWYVRGWVPGMGKVYMHIFLLGHQPGIEIDHRDLDGLNNSRENLRRATSSEQKWNQDLSVRNTSGVKGVSWLSSRKRWQAYIRVHRKMKMLGKFLTFEEAVAARKAAERELHGEFSVITTTLNL